jgi:methionyl-tRNA synthetase
MKKPKFYVTTPIYYVNDIPHIGHAYTTLAADTISRYYSEKIGDENVFFLTGTDEHGQKVAQAAEENKQTPKEYADSVSPHFEEAWSLLNIKHDYFIRTTNPNHEKIVGELLEKVYQKGYIYEGLYKGLYCVGCERFLAESDLENGRCPLHPNKEPVYQEEKNYFFKLKELSKHIIKKIEDGEYEILPDIRKNEILTRLKQGVEDISISRAGVSWGIPIPWDKSQTIYVWVDALINYYSATQFLDDKKEFWPANLHIVGKDILWFHSVIWQGLLIAAGLDLPKTIFAHGFFTIDGQKMSKSLGNVISPKQLVDKYGVDGSRYLIISSYEFGTDGDISIDKFDIKYNAELANGIGNLLARTAKLASNHPEEKFNYPIINWGDEDMIIFENCLTELKFSKYLNMIFEIIKKWDELFGKEEPWLMEESNQIDFLQKTIEDISKISFLLRPIMPNTSLTIDNHFSNKIEALPPLFSRIK